MDTILSRTPAVLVTAVGNKIEKLNPEQVNIWSPGPHKTKAKKNKKIYILFLNINLIDPV